MSMLDSCGHIVTCIDKFHDIKIMCM